MDRFYKKLGARIKTLREYSDLSQEKLAKLLHINRVTLSQIENGDRKLAAEEITHIAKIFNITTDVFLNLQKDIEVVLEKPKPIVIKKTASIRINVPRTRIRKFKEVLLYILNKVGSKPNVGETVLFKLLYFIDFNYYEIYEEQLTGATYIKNTYGPTPKEFVKIVKEMEENDEIVKVENKYFKYPQRKYLPVRKPRIEIINENGNETEVIDNVLKYLSDKNAAELTEYSHNDVPWVTTEDGKIIDYESVFYRTAPYSVRSYDEQNI